MNNKNVYFFGCSFTSLETTLCNYTFKNFRKLLENELEIKTRNFSKVGKSNEHIFNDIYEIASKIENDNEEYYFIIQTTFLYRLGMFCNISSQINIAPVYRNEFISLCKTDGAISFYDKKIASFYKDWLEYFYSEKNSIKEFIKMIEFVSAYLKNKNIKFIFIGIDEGLDLIEDKTFFERNNFLDFKNYKSFYTYAKLNKLRIADILEKNKNQSPDYHFNQMGHDILKEKIIEKLKILIND